MRYLSITAGLLALIAISTCNPISLQKPLGPSFLDAPNDNANISVLLFAELEELSRVVDISYCVGTTGISKPFACASRCNEFPDFELVSTFNTGVLMSDSCGYIVMDHSKRHNEKGRLIVAFRGTYSIANTIVDLSTVPQEYIPYPDNPEDIEDPRQYPSLLSEHTHHRFLNLFPQSPSSGQESADATISKSKEEKTKCNNCTVHSGFWTSWQNTRPFILPDIKASLEKHPEYELHLVGHSLGGAVAGLAGLEMEGYGLKPTITTFGEPRIGNDGLRDWIDLTFSLPSEHSTNGSHIFKEGRYRRVTHVDDPVPLLPLQEWGYRAHAGEVYISKPSLQPSIFDVRLCYGDEDVNCIASAEVDKSRFNMVSKLDEVDSNLEDALEASFIVGDNDEEVKLRKRSGLPIPARYKIWQLFFAHRDYFWRLGLCVPGGDPLNWGRGPYDFGDPDVKQEL